MSKYILFIFLYLPFTGLQAQHVLIKKPVKPNVEAPISQSTKAPTNTAKGDREKVGRKRNIEPAMVYVQGGSFEMGGSGESDGKPIHSVYLNSYYIGKYEVTQAQWKAVMGNNPSEYKGCPTCPVNKVSWYDVQDYLQKLNTLTGKNYRLPTEAEWEYAARGGNKSEGYIYSGSDNLESVAWYNENSNYQAHPVGQKKPNELGIYDMTGSEAEWCSDWYNENHDANSNYYKNSPKENPKGPNSGYAKVVRGGSWRDYDRGSRVAYRGLNRPDDKDYPDYGFRLVLEP